MRVFLSIIPSIFFIACNNMPKASLIQLPPENSKTQIIRLVDSLGNVTINLPIRYDTSFIWTHHSDCGKSCDEIKYRFQPKSLPITQESGFLWLGEPKDSIERFTISHSGYFPFHEIKDRSKDSSFMFRYSKNQKESIIVEDPSYNKIVSDSVEKIGDRYFSVVIVSLYDSTKKQYSKRLWAATTIKTNIIEFRFELLTKQRDSLKDNFIENVKYYLRTLHINTGM